MREKTLLEVSMMLGDAIDKLHSLSLYKPHDVWKDCYNADNHGTISDPYAHLKEAQARGEVIQTKHINGLYKGEWITQNPHWTLPLDRYRIKPKTKPKTKTLYQWAVNSSGSWSIHPWMCATKEEVQKAYTKKCVNEFKRLDYTAIEVEA